MASAVVNTSAKQVGAKDYRIQWANTTSHILSLESAIMICLVYRDSSPKLYLEYQGVAQTKGTA